MQFQPGLKRGDIINNKQLRSIFKCGIQGGMRRSIKTNSLILVSDHTRGIYKDRWDGDILRYTGMGLIGNQSLHENQNRTLYESDRNGINLFLFEVSESKKYYYHGQVKLAGKPYQEKQIDRDNKLRTVWMFPLILVSREGIIHTPEDIFQKAHELERKRASMLSDDELKRRAEAASGKSGSRYVSSKQHDRNEEVAEYAKRRASGKCQLCGSPAPFTYKGEPFLETHHIKWLARGGRDSIDNTVALCPNCHKKMHTLDLKKDRKYLFIQAAKKLT